MPAPDPRVRPFTGATLDRASTERKDPATVAKLLGDPRARAVASGSDGVLIAARDPSALRRIALTPDHGQASILLGFEDDGTPLFALDLDSLAAHQKVELADGGRVMSLREAGTSLPPAEAGLAAYVTALLNWHRKHRFCANCGTSTVIEEAGHSRHCPVCGTHHFPRTDPVVIMTVGHAGRLLLGRRAGWPSPRFSVLAGFVSPGESAEEAVIREVQEESGIVVRDPVFVSSQPWPFPSSLMLGFDAQSDGGEPEGADGELDEVRWFGLADVRAAMEERNADLRLPPPVSIARFLIERWLANQERGSPSRRVAAL